jgi:hypothetical protein
MATSNISSLMPLASLCPLWFIQQGGGRRVSVGEDFHAQANAVLANGDVATQDNALIAVPAKRAARYPRHASRGKCKR